MKTVASNTASGPGLLNDAEAAEFLKVEPRTLRVWRKTRGLPHLRLTSKVIRYRESDLLAWLGRHLVETV